MIYLILLCRCSGQCSPHRGKRTPALTRYFPMAPLRLVSGGRPHGGAVSELTADRGRCRKCTLAHGTGPALRSIDHGRMCVANVLDLCVFRYLALVYLTGRIDYTAIAHSLRRGSDGERDDQEEAARIAAHASFAAVLGRRCLVLGGDRYLCILRRSLLAAKRPMIATDGATKRHAPEGQPFLRQSIEGTRPPQPTARWSANTRTG